MTEIEEIKELLEAKRVPTESDMFGVGYKDSQSAKIASLLQVNSDEGSYSACHIENGHLKAVYLGGKEVLTFKANSPEVELRILEDKVNYGLI